jgi:rhodanese-related sulfurtransferase
MNKQILCMILCLVAACACFAQNNYTETTLPQLMEKIQQGKELVVLDVRSNGEYMDTVPGGKQIGIGRIRNAINISIQDLFQKPETIRQLDAYKDKDIYVICSHSYRSRRVSNLLLENGFKSINNVQGGMTEWYRNYDVLQPYAAMFYENNIPYRNMAPAQLFRKLKAGEPLVMIGFANAPRFAFDSLVIPLYSVFPDFNKVTYFTLADSLNVLDKVKSANGKTVVFFNTIGGGAAEISYWLSQKGFSNVFVLIGNLAGYFEYLANYHPRDLEAQLSAKSKINFLTPLSYCSNPPSNVQWIDMRHDTTFNQVTRGTKLDYKSLKGALHFPLRRSADEFEKEFPDKKKMYILIPERGYAGVDFAEALIRKGYKVGWLMGGIERWEWYTNNIPEFNCKGHHIK